MTSEPVVFAGVGFSSGRKPVTFAALDTDLNVLSCEKWSISESISCLKEFENILLVIDSPVKKADHAVPGDFKKKIFQAGFAPAAKNSPRQWAGTDTEKCFLALCESKLLSRRSFEGRIQRALILYDAGLRIHDPMDVFEEITRHKLIQGILPLENLYSTRELDALIAAYVAWMINNRPAQTTIRDNLILPVRE